jgi:predicted phosphodiesterase
MLALLYDVHGNLSALEAVLEDARDQGATRFILGGDYALFGPCPRETVARLRELHSATWIRGNVDRWAANRDDAPDHPLPRRAIEACRDALGEALVDELGALPAQYVEDGVRYCHGSPVSDIRSFLPEPAPDEAELLAGVTEDRLVFGHTHLPFKRAGPGGVELVNPGSVGIPLDGDTRAALRERFAPAPFAETIAARIENARPESQ